MTSATRAVVFANGDVGVRCLLTLLAAGVEVPLVVTHPAEPHEAGAFASVADAALERRIAVALPQCANAPELIGRVRALAPDFIFSFYYRQMLVSEMLAVAQRGALNMHGSLLPKYRGRAPVNWAVIRGESKTGATLHYMTDKADAGDIVDQQPLPILPDDTAYDVFRKVTVAAEIVLWRTLPALLDGTASRKVQDSCAATYFGRRTPEDGLIDWSADASTIHNLVRGVAPPYPGAYTFVAGRKIRVLKTMRESEVGPLSAPALHFRNDACLAACGGGGVLRLLEIDCDGVSVKPAALQSALGHSDEVKPDVYMKQASAR